MGRERSHCGNNGHNSRTCSNPRCAMHGNNGGGGLRLFGVELHMASSPPPPLMKKSFSMDCLSSSYGVSVSPSHSSSSSSSLVSIDEAGEKISNGYLSDGLMGRTQEKKKGVAWTEEEHRSFLAGLEKLGKGDWRGISRKFVTTRTPTQVASHAQKYFLRQNSLNKKKRRSSLFDVVKSSGKAVHVTETSSKSKDPPSFEECVSNVPIIPMAPGMDLNSSEQEKELPTILNLMPDLPTSMSSSKAKSQMVRPQVHLEAPELEFSLCLHS